MNNAIIDAACISTQNECVKKKKKIFFFIKKSIMNFSESRQNRSRENREKSKNRFFSPTPNGHGVEVQYGGDSGSGGRGIV